MSEASLFLRIRQCFVSISEVGFSRLKGIRNGYGKFCNIRNTIH